METQITGRFPALGSRLSIAYAIVIGAVVLVTYYPLTAAGFFYEDYGLLEDAVRLKFPAFLAHIFGACLQPSFCRPAMFLGMWFEYGFFGSNAQAYRIVQILIHLANCLLLYFLVRQVSKKKFIGLVAAVSYAGLPVVSATLDWFTSPDQGETFFYLLAIIIWLRYLRNSSALNYLLCLAVSVVALFNKEVGVTLPVTLFLVDRWLIRERVVFAHLVRRYLPFVLVWAVYAALALQRILIFTDPQYTRNYSGMGVGTNVLSNLAAYSVMMVSLIQLPGPLEYITLVLVVLAILYYVVIMRNYEVAFACTVGLLTIAPVLMLSFTATRYLYLSIMSSAVLLAAILARIKTLSGSSLIVTILCAGFVGMLVVGNAAGAFEGLAPLTRQYRLPIRPILQEHPSFPEDAYLYFLNSPIQEKNLSGMIALRYGPEVSVGATDAAFPDELREHNSAYVFYYDAQDRVIEQAVDRATQSTIEPALPVNFSIPIRLERYDLVSAHLKRGQSLIVLLKWQAVKKMDKDYTVFGHLLNSRGEMVAGSDYQPREGLSPTSSWYPGDAVADWVLIPIPDDAPIAQDYRLEIGLYDLSTMSRASVVDALGKSFSDRIVIRSIGIED